MLTQRMDQTIREKKWKLCASTLPQPYYILPFYTVARINKNKKLTFPLISVGCKSTA